MVPPVLSNLWKSSKFKYGLIVLALIISSYFLYEGWPAGQKEKKLHPPVVVSSTIVIDTTEDERALGYSGQKKMAQDLQGNLYIGYRKKFNQIYQVYVAKVIKERTGTWQVTHTDQPISSITNKTNQRVPSLVVDTDNNIHLVWYGADSKEREGDRQIKYSRSQNGGQIWSKAINISYVEGFKDQSLWQEHPDIAVTKNGKIYVVWEGKDMENQNQQIKLSSSEDGGNTWSKWINIQPSSNDSQSRPTILEDHKGRLHVFMYSAFNQPYQQIWHSFSDDGIKWSQWENISQNNFDSRHVSAAVTNQNQIIAVWRSPDQDKGKSQIFISLSQGDKWSKPKLVSPSGSYQFFPSVGSDLSDNVYITWMESNKRADFPNENPSEGQILIRVLNRLNEKIFQNKIADNAMYPSVVNNQTTQQTFLTYLLEDGDYQIRLTTIIKK